jgi:hypothetical protein
MTRHAVACFDHGLVHFEGKIVERLADYRKWPRAELFAKSAVLLMKSRGALADVEMVDPDAAQLLRCWTNRSMIEERVKAAASPIEAGDEPWASAQMAAREFLDLVAESSLIGRLPMARRAPFRTATIAPGTDASASWTAEGESKSVTEMTLDAMLLDPFKVSSIAVLTNDLIRGSPVDAEAAVVSDERNARGNLPWRADRGELGQHAGADRERSRETWSTCSPMRTFR